MTAVTAAASIISIIRGRGLTRSFPMASGPVVALRDVSIDVDPGEYVAITGPSGCGKSTLLHLLGCVDGPTSGSLLFEGRNVARLSESERSRKLYRSRGSVEREFGRLKHEWALSPLRVRGLERVRLHADLTILAKLSCALARARAVQLAA